MTDEARPLFTSVWEGNDAELIEQMLVFYARIDAEPILDVTANVGRFWRGSSRDVTTMDHDPRFACDITGDFRLFAGVSREGEPVVIEPESYNTIVFDPPHIGPQGRSRSNKPWDVQYGAHVECGREHDWNLSYLYPPFLAQAYRALRPQGLVLAKITDMVNNHVSKWPHMDYMRDAQAAGLTVCDLIVKVRTNPLQSSRWQRQHHARKRHSFWIICRKGRC